MSKIGLFFILLVSGCCLSCMEKKQGAWSKMLFLWLSDNWLPS